MKPAIKWALIIGGVGVTGAVAYFIWKKMKRPTKSGSNIADSKNGQSTISSNVSNNVSTPFVNKEEGDTFRAWVNNKYPTYAKSIELDKSGSYNNSYIQKAWTKYGKEYSFSIIPKYVGLDAKLNNDKTLYSLYLPSRKFIVGFYNNGRYVINDSASKKVIQKGSYSLGGRIMKADNGKSVRSGSVFRNIKEIA